MEICALLVADPQPSELVQPGKCALHDPTRLSQAGAVRDAFSGELGCDAASPEKAAVLVVVVTAVGEQPSWPVPGSTADTADAGYRIEQGHQLGDVVAVPAGQ